MKRRRDTWRGYRLENPRVASPHVFRSPYPVAGVSPETPYDAAVSGRHWLATSISATKKSRARSKKTLQTSVPAR